MFNVILTMTKDGGIGFEGKLPWNCNESVNLFNQITSNSLIIVGRKTAESFLTPLIDKKIVVLSSNKCGKYATFSCLFDALFVHNDTNIFIAGGAELYNDAFNSWKRQINRVYLSVMKDDYNCDTFIKLDPMNWTVDKKISYDKFTHYELLPVVPDESKYLRLLEDVYKNGWEKKGRNGITKSMFGKTIEFDLTKGYPLLTTKAMFFRGIVEELLFFIRGETDSKLLSDKKIKIWNGNTNREFLDFIGKSNRREGVMGPMYGYQWRNFNSEYNEEKATCVSNGMDQLKNVIEQIRNDPHSRRILLTDFNPLQAHEGVLFPCHSIIIQFYVQDGYLDMFCFNRSSDLFHGLPFNIASSSLFQILIAKITGLTARKFILSLGDVHIYESHYDVVSQQLTRIPFLFPKVEIGKDIKNLDDIEKLEYSDFNLVNYLSYGTLKADMVN